MHSPIGMLQGAFSHLPFWLAVSGIASAWFIYLQKPIIAEKGKAFFTTLGIYKILENKYYLDALYIDGIAAMVRKIGWVCWQVGEIRIIDGGIVNGAAYVVNTYSKIARRLQTGYVYHYAFAMIFGVLILLSVWVMRILF